MMPQRNAHRIMMEHQPPRLFVPISILIAVLFLFLGDSFAEEPMGLVAGESSEPVKQESNGSVELNGDHVEFIMEGNKFVAEGNVSVIKGDAVLTCDKVEFYKDSKIAIAQGNVVLKTPQGSIAGDKMTFNFGDMTGEFMGAKITAEPFFGAGESVGKVGENHMVLTNGYLTTCDHDKPHFRFTSRKIDVYPGDKMAARNVCMIIGKIPIFYIPKYTQSISDKKPLLTFTPGYDKQWGAFLLTNLRYYFSENFKGVIHLDFRERKGIASGIDLNYKTPKTGSGIVRTYYMDERPITSKHIWDEQPSPTPSHERYKVEWRHKWTIDEKTDAIWQYYKLSGPTFLKDYFEKEYEKDQNPASFFLLTRTLPKGTLSFRSDVRINTYESIVERLPEIKYDIVNQKIGDTGFYFQSIDTYSNLVLKGASPTEVNLETVRVDSEDLISHPLKLSIFEMNPYVGGRQTYYSRTKDPAQYDVIRGAFRTGVDISTKFYKTYALKSNLWGMDINRLRHIITPSISYKFAPDPTIPSSKLDSFDAIDSITRDHTITFGLENKLQTKRLGNSEDLLRFLLGTDFRLKEYTGTGGFDQVRSDTEFHPLNWLRLSLDTGYDTHKERLNSANFDMYINGENDKWFLNFGKRYNVEVDDQITTEFGYKINPKWKFSLYERYDIDKGLVKEQGYKVTRDLHEWEMDVLFSEKRGEGSEIMLIFRLKAFPEATIDFGSSFNKRKTGSQSSVGN